MRRIRSKGVEGSLPKKQKQRQYHTYHVIKTGTDKPPLRGKKKPGAESTDITKESRDEILYFSSEVKDSTFEK